MFIRLKAAALSNSIKYIGTFIALHIDERFNIAVTHDMVIGDKPSRSSSIDRRRIEIKFIDAIST